MDGQGILELGVLGGRGGRSAGKTGDLSRWLNLKVTLTAKWLTGPKED